MIESFPRRASRLKPGFPAPSAAETRLEAAIPYLAVALLLFGTATRLAQYLADRSLWLDEALLSLNILERSIPELAGRLDFEQGAPLGFLVVEKLMVLAIDGSELTLRLFPLVCGLAALPLFYAVSRRVVPAAAALLALLFFANAEGLIYYSAEAKQYSGDVLAATALYVLAFAESSPLSWRRLLVFSGTAAVALWFSHASLFVAAGIVLAIGLEALFGARWRELARLAAALVPAVASAAVFFVVSYPALRGLQGSFAVASPGVVSLPLADVMSPLQWTRSLVGDFVSLLGLPASDRPDHAVVRALAGVLLLVGAVGILRRRPRVFLALTLPVVFMAIASALGRYPIFPRTVLFALPAVILFLANGIGMVTARLRPATAIGIGALVLALWPAAYPALSAAQHLGEPRTKEEIKPLLAHLAARWRPGDTLYVHPGAQYAFRYYAQCGCFEPSASQPLTFAQERRQGPASTDSALASAPPHFMIGAYADHDWSRYLAELDSLRGRARVWVLSSHPSNPGEERFLSQAIPDHLDRFGLRLEQLSRPRARLYLYDLSGNAAS